MTSRIFFPPIVFLAMPYMVGSIFDHLSFVVALLVVVGKDILSMCTNAVGAHF